MSIPHSQPVLTTEISSLPSTSRRLWSSTRSIPEFTSPTTLSPVSELSEISHLEFTSSDPSNSSPNPLPPNPLPATTSNISSDISDPTTHLSIPQLPISTVPPISIPTMNNPPIYPLAQMPLRGDRKAPRTFKGHYWKVARFIDQYEQLLNAHQVVSDEDKCRGILEYCSQKVEDLITSCPSYIGADWDSL